MIVACTRYEGERKEGVFVDVEEVTGLRDDMTEPIWTITL